MRSMPEPGLHTLPCQDCWRRCRSGADGFDGRSDSSPGSSSFAISVSCLDIAATAAAVSCATSHGVNTLTHGHLRPAVSVLCLRRRAVMRPGQA
jgi:hypothetical protein